MNKIDIYTDGACIGNPGPGGWAFIIKYEDGKTEEHNGSKDYTTNNKMEITAAIKALTFIKKKTKINVYTDSKYLKDGITIWINKWKLNGWQTSNKKNVKNLDLWKLLEKNIKVHEIKWYWVKSHNDNILNEKADILAKEAVKD